MFLDVKSDVLPDITCGTASDTNQAIFSDIAPEIWSKMFLGKDSDIHFDIASDICSDQYSDKAVAVLPDTFGLFRGQVS